MLNYPFAEVPIRVKSSFMALHPMTIESVFTEAVMDLKRVIVLDGIDILPDKSGFRIRSHDLHGQLPQILIKDSGDTFQDKERVGIETCKLTAIAGLRDQMWRGIRGGRFLPPTRIGDSAIVGFRARPYNWLAEGRDFLKAYHELHQKMFG